MVSEEERSYAAHNATHHGLSCGAHPLARDMHRRQPYHTLQHSPSLAPSLEVVTTVAERESAGSGLSISRSARFAGFAG